MKNIIVILASLFIVIGCSNQKSDPASSEPPKTAEQLEKEKMIKEGLGVGEIKNVTLNDPLDQTMISRGNAIYEMKCAACHRLTDMRVVGPGFEGLTNRRKPEWIMNMITNVEIMLDEDPVAQKLFEECLTRMPNQNVSIGDARDILEFMLDNDAE